MPFSRPGLAVPMVLIHWLEVFFCVLGKRVKPVLGGREMWSRAPCLTHPPFGLSPLWGP